jgi:hypothetical protein
LQPGWNRGKLRHSTGKRKETPTLDIVVVLATIISGHQSTEVLVAPKTYAAFKRRRLNFHVSPDHNSPVSNCGPDGKELLCKVLTETHECAEAAATATAAISCAPQQKICVQMPKPKQRKTKQNRAKSERNWLL